MHPHLESVVQLLAGGLVAAYIAAHGLVHGARVLLRLGGYMLGELDHEWQALKAEVKRALYWMR